MATNQTLPIDSYLSRIEKAVTEKSNVIIVAEPGAGKTTRVPVAVSRSGQKWIVLQPRRWAAKLTAARIAEENHWRLGEEVGFQIRFESKASKHTRILIMTEGVLLRKLIQDPELLGYAGVILDEFHERSLDLDLAISILKEIQASLRPDLKLIVMSATLDPTPLEAYLPETQTFLIPGRTFPVKKRYLGELRPSVAVKAAIEECGDLPQYQKGDVLVFLPGAYDIDRTVSDLRSDREISSEYEVLPLYASLPDSDQKKVFSPSGKPKIICSTNIAETSLTLPNVKIVIDSGWAKVMRTDPQLGQDRLETVRISSASAEQRAGRAGRVSEGVAFRLWSEGEQSQLRRFETPEIHRVHLGQGLLFLSDFGVQNFESFDWYEKPKSSMLQFSVRELEAIGFLDQGRITNEGRLALKIPLGPRLAKLILVSERKGVKAFGARVAAFLESRLNDDPVTHAEQWIRRMNQLFGPAFQSAKQVYGGMECPPLAFEAWPLYQEILIEVFRNKIFVADKVTGRRKVSARERILPKAGLILQSMEKSDRGGTVIQVQSFVELDLEVLKKKAETRKRTFWDEDAKKVRTVSGLFFEDLELGPLTEVATDKEVAQEVLLKLLLEDPHAYLSKNESYLEWHARVRFYNRVLKPEEAKLSWEWESVLSSLVEDKTKLDAVIEGPVVSMIEGQWDRKQIQQFEAWAPERLEVPSGSMIRIDYASGEKPKLSVRLQEIFGWIETPRLAGGRAPLLIELLSPSFKGLQLTQDLKSFWANAYFEVKKEMKARYPKHAWPDDPLTAKPEAKGRRRSS